MGNLRTIRELIADLGILDAEKDVFREDVFVFLEEHTGSLSQTLTLPASDIRRLSRRFIDSDKGTFYFARRGTSNRWSHGTSREDVECALPDIIRRWIRNKKDTVQRSGTTYPLPTTETVLNAKNSTAPSRLPNDAASAASLPSKRAEPAHSTKTLRPAFELDDDTTYLPDISHDGQTDTSSLPDIADLVRGRRKLPPPPRHPHEWSVSPVPELEPRPLSDDEVPLRMLSKKPAAPQTPLNISNLGLLSPPVTSPKRKHVEVSKVEQGLEATASSDSSLSKKPRRDHDHEQVNSGVSILPAIEPQRAPESLIGQAMRAQFRAADALPTPTSAALETFLEDAKDKVMQNSTVHVVSLSAASPYSKTVCIQYDELLSIPKVILDYIRKCEKSSLTRLNTQDTTNLERKRHQERCKLFRDLHADIESRIMGLASRNATDDPSMASTANLPDMSQAEISSYALWD